MTRQEYLIIENYMRSCMQDNVHDVNHVYRVLYYAIDIASTMEDEINLDIVITAALLHDIGRIKEHNDSSICHARAGAEMARVFLTTQGYDNGFILDVQKAILAHRYKDNKALAAKEQMILYDADKLDLTGAVGATRAILFGGVINEPLYIVDAQGKPTKGEITEGPSLFREYNRKLSKMKDKFYTKRAQELAKKHQELTDVFFNSLFLQVNENYYKGKQLIDEILK